MKYDSTQLDLDLRAFVPGDIDEVKDYCGVEDSPEIQYLNAIWTPQAIADYKLLTEQEGA